MTDPRRAPGTNRSLRFSSTVGAANFHRTLLALLITAGPGGSMSAAPNTYLDPALSQTSDATSLESDPFDPEHLAAEVRANPESRSARWNYGFVLFRHGDIEAAEEQFRYADKLGPDAYSSLMRGVIAEQQLRYTDALGHYKTAEELPGNATSSERATENRSRLNDLLEDLRRFRGVDRRLDRDLWIATLAFAGFALVILRITRPRPD